MKYDVFISYRRVGGKEYARTLKPELEKRGFKVFLDFDDLDDGVFDHRIKDAISNSPVFLLILSKGALDRCINEGDWVREEILHAVKCGCHMVPVEFDKTFREIPEGTPKEISSIIGPHSWAPIDTEGLLQESIDKMVKKRIAPYVHREDAETGAEIHIDVDADCDLFRFKTFIRQLKAGEDNVIHLKPGEYRLDFVSVEFPEVKEKRIREIEIGKESYYIEVELKKKVEEVRAKRKAEEEARHKAEEEARRKAEEEARRKAEEEARRKAEEERKKQAKELYQLGEDYYYGRNGKSKDYSEAAKCYRKAAELGNADAQGCLGWMYESGEGVPQNSEEAVKWYRKAAEQGNADAQYNLGVMYDNGQGVPQNYEEAVKWYRKAADQGNADAQCNLGWMYENGKGVSKSDEEAVKWYRKAAEQGHADAQYNLGVMYHNGQGVPQGYEEAVKWFRKAAEQGYARAQYNLGYMYKYGEGVPKSEEEAVKWYRKAAEQGDEDAKKALKRLGK